MIKMAAEKGGEEGMGNEDPDFPSNEGWLYIYPNYCEQNIMLIHDSPQPMLVVLTDGMADIIIDNHQHPMHRKVVIQVSGTVRIHNTNRDQNGIPSTGQPGETAVAYKHLT